MIQSGHSNFIATPISAIISETGRACMSLGDGIETFPLASYIMQTTFLRLTGASEQKLKCICWEVASFDYEFRYEMLRSHLGECSSYKDKNDIFKSICQSLKRHDNPVEFNDVEKDRIIKMATVDFLHELKSSPLATIYQREYMDFQKFIKSNPLKKTLFCNGNNGKISFIESVLKDYYEDYVYRQRNRYAHNLTSYQINLPNFSRLAKIDSESNNHFRMISILIFIDGIFMTLFEKFLAVKISHSY